MKIGIVTFHCSYNYGSALQAWALQEYLKKSGYDAKIINYVDLVNFEDYQLFRTSLYKKKIKSLIGDIVYLPVNLKRKRGFEGFQKEFFDMTDKRYTSISDMRSLNDELDTFICGSDQIWNINCTKGPNPAFFLAFADDSKRKIAYAPSIADKSIDFTDNDEVKSYLKGFDYISVREKSFVKMLSDITGKDVVSAVDPTLLLNESDYSTLITESPVNDKKYIFVYSLEDNDKMNDYANRLSRDKGMPVVYINKKTQHCFENGINVYGASPSEFLALVKNAQYVVTNSFHATVFSVIFEKQLCTFATLASGSRMMDLLGTIGLDDRLYSENFDIDKKSDFAKGKAELSLLSNASKKFLNNALSGEI